MNDPFDTWWAVNAGSRVHDMDFRSIASAAFESATRQTKAAHQQELAALREELLGKIQVAKIAGEEIERNANVKAEAAEAAIAKAGKAAAGSIDEARERFQEVTDRLMKIEVRREPSFRGFTIATHIEERLLVGAIGQPGTLDTREAARAMEWFGREIGAKVTTQLCEMNAATLYQHMQRAEERARGPVYMLEPGASPLPLPPSFFMNREYPMKGS